MDAPNKADAKDDLKLSVAGHLTNCWPKTTPEWNPTKGINREYEARLYDYYGRPVGWWSGSDQECPPPPKR
jgi:hypothetical protein